jgi:hypothetical protein
MNSILEQALVHLLNEEHEKAEELMHQFVVDRARQIHEGLREQTRQMAICPSLTKSFSLKPISTDDDAVDNLKTTLAIWLMPTLTPLHADI